MNDDFFLGWLAREVRFQVGIHFRQRQYLGYTVYRRVLTTKKDEPAMNMWLAEKGVHGRVLKNAERSHQLPTRGRCQKSFSDTRGLVGSPSDARIL